MTIDQAIRIIQKDRDDEAVDWGSPLGEAYKLSFEALKDLKKFDEIRGKDARLPLPGETKD
ncbi:hypothetical protein ES703_120465 [subsurface metagenome]